MGSRRACLCRRRGRPALPLQPGRNEDQGSRARSRAASLLGLARDADANTYACDERSACVHRIAPDGKVSTYANGNAEQKMRLPNYPVFDDHGNLYVSDSGSWAATGRLHLEGRSGRQGRDLGPAGERLHQWHVPVGRRQVALRRRILARRSSRASRSRRTGSAGRREVIVELPRQVPDGLAFDTAGDLYISLYNPNIVYRVSPLRAS